MRKILIITAALLATLSLRADEPASSYSITTDFTYASEYIFRGLELSDQALQPSVNVKSGNLSLGVWSSQALSNRSAVFAQGSEIDVFGGYSFTLTESYTLTLGGTIYLYPSARPSLGEIDKTVEPSLSVSGPIGPLSGSATYYKDLDLEADTFQFSLGYSIPLPDEKGSFDLSATYGLADIGDTNAGLPGSSGLDYRYWAVSAAWSHKLTSAATLKVSANYTGVSRVTGAPKNLWFSVGVSTGL